MLVTYKTSGRWFILYYSAALLRTKHEFESFFKNILKLCLDQPSAMLIRLKDEKENKIWMKF